MNIYFINISKNLNLKPLDQNKDNTDMFDNHVSIKKMHQTFPNIIPENFHFKEVSIDDVDRWHMVWFLRPYENNSLMLLCRT